VKSVNGSHRLGGLPQDEDVKAQVLSAKSEEDVLEWCQANGPRLTAEQILIYNSFMSKRGWRDDETGGFIPEMIKEYGVKTAAA